MSESWKRTHTCGELRHEIAGEPVALAGWVHSLRDHGKLRFIDLRDRYGITQLCIDSSEVPGVFELAGTLRTESVIAVKGKVTGRPEGNVNQERLTGEIEVLVESIEVLGPCDVPPFDIHEDAQTQLELRLAYRFLDLRRPEAMEPLVFKAALYHELRNHFYEERFLELETPMLTRTTPEGAREFIVPSRLHRSHFYALAQSPQIFKQLFMCAGFDRYAQIVRCFRDEDFRSDRQPEFTQLDVEMSFVDEEDVIGVVERAMARVFRVLLSRELELPLPRLSFNDAMNRYGSDKPDLRFELELTDLTKLAGASEFQAFRKVVEVGGTVKALRIEGGAERLTRKMIDELTAWISEQGARGLAWIKLGGESASGPLSKFFTGPALAALCSAAGARTGDLIFAVADESWERACNAIGALRQRMGIDLGLITPGTMKMLWVTPFPSFEFDAEAGRWLARHHPFTSPTAASLDSLESDPGRAQARAYDLVLNGSEIAGGSIRIHRLEVQERVFALLGISKEEAKAKFGFLLEALRFGAPPHGGIAVGLDRLAACLLGLDSIRDVIAYPKTARGICPLTGAPASVDAKQLVELGISTGGGEPAA